MRIIRICCQGTHNSDDAFVNYFCFKGHSVVERLVHTTQYHNSCQLWGREGIIRSRLWGANLNIKLCFQIH